MKKVAFTLTIFFFFFLSGCSDQVSEVQYSDLAMHNMKIIPENPTSNDEIKLVVLDDCTYNQLSGVSKKGNTVDVQKQFNSMMKWPCVMKNDTIMIGKLPEGTYTVNYKLVDISTQVSNQTALSFSFSLPVSK
jgi:hypothetical protein